jgi:16S rRNA (cytosine1402-N4)-methyltransferase
VDNSGLHTTVLLHEAIDALVTASDGIYVDGTFGRGGHTRELLGRLGPGARVIGIDKDPVAVAAARQGRDAIADPRFEIVHAGFAQLPATLAERGIARIDGLLLDLGVSSPQIDTPERGFSFRFDGPLDMRMDTTRGETAADFLARADERHIAEVIRDYGEERFAVSIAKVKTREPNQDPATRTFQALRIFVNAELEELEQVLKSAVDLLAPGARLAVISFHSLEDRIVKTFIARESRAEVDRRAPFAPPSTALRLAALGRIKPGPTEVLTNGRARSAILRVAERL